MTNHLLYNQQVTDPSTVHSQAFAFVYSCSSTVSEGRDVFPCDFRAKIDFFALNDCFCVIIMKNDGVQFF